MKKKKILFTGIGAAALVVMATAGLTNAYFGGIADEETRDKLHEAVEDKDYDSWKEIQDNIPKITDIVENQEDFEKMIEMKDLYKSGDKEAAEALREELGLPEMKGKGMHGGKGGRGGNPEARQAVEEKDYNAWLEATSEDSPIREHIENEEDFNKLIEMHEAREAGDKDKADEIREELGMPEKGGRGGPRGGQKGEDSDSDDA